VGRRQILQKAHFLHSHTREIRSFYLFEGMGSFSHFERRSESVTVEIWPTVARIPDIEASANTLVSTYAMKETHETTRT
jgi:hypothetical protein